MEPNFGSKGHCLNLFKHLAEGLADVASGLMRLTYNKWI